MDKDDLLAKAGAHLLTRAETDGVAVVNVRDGAVYAFSKKKLLELVQVCEDSGQDTVIVMVKNGPLVEDTLGN